MQLLSFLFSCFNLIFSVFIPGTNRLDTAFYCWDYSLTDQENISIIKDTSYEIEFNHSYHVVKPYSVNKSKFSGDIEIFCTAFIDSTLVPFKIDCPYSKASFNSSVFNLTTGVSTNLDYFKSFIKSDYTYSLSVINDYDFYFNNYHKEGIYNLTLKYEDSNFSFLKDITINNLRRFSNYNLISEILYTDVTKPLLEQDLKDYLFIHTSLDDNYSLEFKTSYFFNSSISSFYLVDVKASKDDTESFYSFLISNKSLDDTYSDFSDTGFFLKAQEVWAIIRLLFIIFLLAVYLYHIGLAG